MTYAKRNTLLALCSVLAVCWLLVPCSGSAADKSEGDQSKQNAEHSEKKAQNESSQDKKSENGAATADKETFEPFTVVITPDALNIRAKPGTHYEILGQYEKGAKVEVKAIQQGWYNVPVPEDARAWVADRLVDQKGVIQKNRVRVRAGAGLAFTPYSYVNKGQKVELLDKTFHGWRKIKPPETAMAWISRKYARRIKPEKETTETKVAKKDKNDKEPDQPEKKGQSDEKEGATESREDSEKKPEKGETAKADKEQKGEPSRPETKETPSQEDDQEQVTGKTGEQDEDEGQAPPEESGLDMYAEARPAPGTTRQTSHIGMIIDLGKKRTGKATHVLAREVEGITYPVCYLTGPELDLDSWEMKHVRVYGQERWLKGWKRPLVRVNGVVLASGQQ